MPSATERPRALVTGAARRLGAAFALDLARRGWDLVVHYHQSEADAREVAQAVGRLGRRARLVSADLSAPGGVEALVERLEDTPPSLIVHSASQWTADTWESASADEWEASHRLHGWSALVLARALRRWAQPESHLVTLLDARLRDRDPQHFSYAFAKRELANLTRALALELAPQVRVNGLAPGLILKADDAPRAPWLAAQGATPMGRSGKPADLVRALRFLVDNPFVTGEILTVDGGRHLKGDLFGSL